MNCELLLHWMTHLGEGSWALFKRSVLELAPEDEDQQRLCLNLRMRLSDLGHADFFVDGSQRWQVFSPVLGGVSGMTGSFILTGGRTPTLVDALKASAGLRGACISDEIFQGRPARIVLEASHGDAQACAAECGVRFSPDLGVELAGSLVPIPLLIERAAPVKQPINWDVRSFDLSSMEWVEKLLPDSACEFYPRVGASRYFLHRRRGRLVELPKREAVFASAMIRRIELIRWDQEESELSTPFGAPLPEPYSRAACLCSGEPPEASVGRVRYRLVPADAASLILVAAGQLHPLSRTA